jgi:fatty acid-binding protein DegV
VSRRVALVTDSSAQLGPARARRAQIAVVPVTVVVDGDPAAEVDVDLDAFDARLAAGAEVTTATPGPGAFADAYERLADEGAGEVISLHLDERVSGVVAAARLGAEAAPVPVHVVDTRQVSFGVGLCALRARRVLSGRGGSTAAIAAARRLSARLRNASFVAAPPSPGRVDARDAVVAVVDGATTVIDADVDASAAPERLAALVLSDRGPFVVAVGHAGPEARDGADALARLLERAPAVEGVLRYRVGPSVSAHIGPRAFGCFWWPSHETGPEARLD